MSDDVKEQNSTPPEELRRQIMSYSEPKNEREWWAMHRIEQLEAALRRIAQHDLQAIAIDALRPGERVPLEKKD